jgi:acyl dehydratase
MIDTKWIGHRFPVMRWEVEKGRLRFFAKAIGETRPEYIDEVAAKAAGYLTLLAPPTILFSGPLDHGSVSQLLQLLDISMNNILHGEQGFTYHVPVLAGDVLEFEDQITDIVSKKGGALELVTREARVTNQRGELVAVLRNVVVVVNKS